MKYNDIVRISNKDLSDLRPIFLHNEREGIQKVLEFYSPQINTILSIADSPFRVSKDNIDIDFEEHVYNNNPNILSVYISCKPFNFYLEEMFNNCGILVSTNTFIYYNCRNLGIGTILQAIKEDIAKIANYSFLMYTDSVNTEILKANQKIMNNIGAKEIFRGINRRSDNNIAVWIKDLNEYYENRELKVAVEAIEETN